MWRQMSQDAHQYRENKVCLRQKKAVRGKMTIEANIIIRPDARRSAARATSTWCSNPSHAQFLTYFACSDISDAPSSMPVAYWRSTRPKPLTAPRRHSQLSLRPPLCRATRSRHPSRSFDLMIFCAHLVALTTISSFPYVYLKRSTFAALRALLVCCDQTRGKGAGGRRRTSPLLRMRPRSLPESGSWEHSLLVVGGGK